MTKPDEITALSNAIGIVLKAWCSIPDNMNNPQANKVWRILRYLETRQQILVIFASCEG